MPASDDVSLPDLQVIQRYSLAVRGATARRADVIAALRADLEWLTGSSALPAVEPAPAPVRKAPAKQAAVQQAPVKKAAAKASGKTVAKKSGARRA